MARAADAPALELARSAISADAILITPADPAALAAAIGLADGWRW